MEPKYASIAYCLIGLLIVVLLMWREQRQQKTKPKRFCCDLCGNKKVISSSVYVPSVYEEDIELCSRHFWCQECAGEFGFPPNAILCSHGGYKRITTTPTSTIKNPPADT